ncbi:MAG: succinate dehydrogenase, hydrophobic membrane anchor protein [Asticcacaulis sp.]
MSEPLDVAARSVKNWKISSHHGAGEWLAERFTSLALIPLTLWCAWAACQVVGGHDAALAFVKVPLYAGLIAVTVLISIWHMYMGLKVIIDDYLQGAMRGFVMLIVVVLCLAVLAAVGFGLYTVVSGNSFYALFFAPRGAA